MFASFIHLKLDFSHWYSQEMHSVGSTNPVGENLVSFVNVTMVRQSRVGERYVWCLLGRGTFLLLLLLLLLLLSSFSAVGLPPEPFVPYTNGWR